MNRGSVAARWTDVREDASLSETWPSWQRVEVDFIPLLYSLYMI